jgi:hypothetical protein
MRRLNTYFNDAILSLLTIYEDDLGNIWVSRVNFLYTERPNNIEHLIVQYSESIRQTAYDENKAHILKNLLHRNWKQYDNVYVDFLGKLQFNNGK